MVINNNTMSFIQFESGWEKEKARQELRDVRAEILKRVNIKFIFIKHNQLILFNSLG